MRIALYARASTKDKGQDYENQLRDLRDFVTRKASDGWVLAHEYRDMASGKSAGRPAFRRMLDAASRKEFDLGLFWSLDRFSREGAGNTSAPPAFVVVRRGMVQLPRGIPTVSRSV